MVKKGLEGVVVDTSSISKVIPEINSLVYRGYKVQDLAEMCSFEEVSHLLLKGELPTQSQLKEFSAMERGKRGLSDPLLSVIQLYPKTAHPMDTIRTSVSYAGMEDPRVWDNSPATNLDKAITLLAKIPTMIAADYRVRRGKTPIAPKSDLSICENFFHMCFGEVPHKDIVKAFEVSMVLYAEHSFNASTFTSRVVASTTSDLYSAVVAGIGALKGPLHGGANEQVMHMLLEVADPKVARQWMIDALEQKKKVMGFGHRVYKSGDSRVPTMKKYAVRLGEIKGERKWAQISDELEKVMVEQKNIHPNLDFPAGPAYYLMGFEIDMFTPLFVMSRITGWSAHIMEQLAANRLIRPTSQYTGPGERAVKPLSAR